MKWRLPTLMRSATATPPQLIIVFLLKSKKNQTYILCTCEYIIDLFFQSLSKWLLPTLRKNEHPPYRRPFSYSTTHLIQFIGNSFTFWSKANEKAWTNEIILAFCRHYRHLFCSPVGRDGRRLSRDEMILAHSYPWRVRRKNIYYLYHYLYLLSFDYR